MSDSMARVQQLAAEVAALRATIPRPSDAEFMARLDELLRTENDPQLHEAIWSFKEGKLDRSDVMRHPAYGRVCARRVMDTLNSLSPEEAAVLHERIAEMRDEVDEPSANDDLSR